MESAAIASDLVRALEVADRCVQFTGAYAELGPEPIPGDGAAAEDRQDFVLECHQPRSSISTLMS
jgi:hypothetical protein